MEAAQRLYDLIWRGLDELGMEPSQLEEHLNSMDDFLEILDHLNLMLVDEEVINKLGG